MIRLLSFFLLLTTLGPFECLLRGYQNSRSWGTGRQGRVVDTARSSRMGRRLTLAACERCVARDLASGPVCGTDGKTYPSLCRLKETSCSLVRRQGRSLQSRQLSLELSQPGPCSQPCHGMETLGQFSAWGVRATNFGLCVQDFFTCARMVTSKGTARGEAEACCQARFDQCYKG